MNTPNNPTGAVWNPETVKAIGEWAVEHHVWVISDEIYEHLNYDGAKTTYIGAAVPEVRDQLLVLNGVAKTYAMPGWRVGWMIAPLDVAKAASKLQGHMTSNVNNISQRAAIAAVSGSLDAVYEMREAFDKRRQTIVDRVERYRRCELPDADRRILCVRRRERTAEQAARHQQNRLCELRPNWLRHCLTKVMWRPFQAKRSALPATCDSRTRLPTTTSLRA